MATAMLGPTLIVVCLLFALTAAMVYRVAGLGTAWTVPVAAARAAAQLAAISAVLVAAMTRLWSSAAVLAVMFLIAVYTAAGRSQADRGRTWLALPLATGVAAVVPALVVTGLIPLAGTALIPTVAIILGGSMTAVAVAARRSLDTLATRRGEVEAALSLGLSERDSRRLVIERSTADALLPNVDQARTAGLVTLPGAFVGVLLATGSAAQAGAVQVLVLVGLLLAQGCGVAVTGELVARGRLSRTPTHGDAVSDHRRSPGHTLAAWALRAWRTTRSRSGAA